MSWSISEKGLRTNVIAAVRAKIGDNRYGGDTQRDSVCDLIATQLENAQPGYDGVDVTASGHQGSGFAVNVSLFQMTQAPVSPTEPATPAEPATPPPAATGG